MESQAILRLGMDKGQIELLSEFLFSLSRGEILGDE